MISLTPAIGAPIWINPDQIISAWWQNLKSVTELVLRDGIRYEVQETPELIAIKVHEEWVSRRGV